MTKKTNSKNWILQLWYYLLKMCKSSLNDVTCTQIKKYKLTCPFVSHTHELRNP
jgi:hypothetical protein